MAGNYNSWSPFLTGYDYRVLFFFLRFVNISIIVNSINIFNRIYFCLHRGWRPVRRIQDIMLQDIIYTMVHRNLAPMRLRASLSKTTKLGVHYSCSKPRFCVTYTTNRQSARLHVGNTFRYLHNIIILYYQHRFSNI